MTDYRQALAALSGGHSKAAGIPRVSAADILAEVVARLPDASLPVIEDLDRQGITESVVVTLDTGEILFAVTMGVIQ